MHTQQQSEIQAQRIQKTPRVTKTPLQKEGSVLLSHPVSHPAVDHLLQQKERTEFYTGKESATLQINQIQKVRALQEANDNLQRQIAHNQKELLTTSDPLLLLADIEHCNIMISRNTGEIMNIYAQNEQRLKRIALLEAQNDELRRGMENTQEKFSSSHEMDSRTKIASEFFSSKSQYEKNLNEIYTLHQES